MHSVRPIRSLKLLHRYDYTLKARFVLKIFNFCLEFFVMQKNGLIRKIRIISKFMAVNKELKYVYWPNLKKQGQSGNEIIEYNWQTFLLKNHTENVAEKLFPGPLLKNQNWAYLWINISEFFTVCFYFMPNWGL